MNKDLERILHTTLDNRSLDGKFAVKGFPGKYGENGKVILYQKKENVWEDILTIRIPEIEEHLPTFGKFAFLNKDATLLIVAAPGRVFHLYFYKLDIDNSEKIELLRSSTPFSMSSVEGDFLEGVDITASDDLSIIFVSSYDEKNSQTTVSLITFDDEDNCVLRPYQITEDDTDLIDSSVPSSVSLSGDGLVFVRTFMYRELGKMCLAITERPTLTPRYTHIYALDCGIELLRMAVNRVEDTVVIYTVPRKPTDDKVKVTHCELNLSKKMIKSNSEDFQFHREYYDKYGELVYHQL